MSQILNTETPGAGRGGSPLELLEESGGKKIVFCHDEASGLRAVIAIHSTALGPAAGGVRFKNYASLEEATVDAVRLARAMTLKYAAAGMRMGGGKAVVIGDARTDKTPALLRALGRFIEEQGGEYSGGEDVGTTGEDMEVLAEETEWLVSLPEAAGGAGDVSITTAEGVYNAIRACSRQLWGSPDVSGRRVAIQGLGQVGMKLARLLAEGGANLVVADLDQGRTSLAAERFGAEVVPTGSVCEQRVDILAPCALGDAINDSNVESIAASAIAGAANNVFSSTRVAERIEERGIVYAVDFVANAGGIVYDDQLRTRPKPTDLDREAARAYVDGIYDRTLRVFEIAAEEQVPIWRAGLRLAEENLPGGAVSAA
jgi:leucine dehydrogenase